MKHITQLLTLLLSCLGSAVLAQSGMAVFGDVSIGEKAVISFMDEQLTLEGNLTGEGTLLMAGSDTQTIASHNHAIDRLVVANPKAVTVRGKLTIRKSVVVKLGSLVVEPQAELELSMSAVIALRPGSKLIYSLDVFQTDKATFPVVYQWINSVGTVNTPVFLPDERRIALTDSTRLDLNTTHYQEPDLGAQVVPPRRVNFVGTCD